MNSLHSGQSSDLLKNPAGKREMILDAALHLFTTEGFHGAPTSQISKMAGISTGTLFHYFPDKNVLIDQLYLTIKKDLADEIQSQDNPALGSKYRLEKCFRGFINWGMDNPEKIRFLEQFYHSPSIGEAVKVKAGEEFEWMREIITEAIRDGVIRDLPFEFFGVMTCQVLFGVLRLISSNSCEMSVDEIIESGFAMIWIG
jgi:AcrR family transcriptional regulator